MDFRNLYDDIERLGEPSKRRQEQLQRLQHLNTVRSEFPEVEAAREALGCRSAKFPCTVQNLEIERDLDDFPEHWHTVPAAEGSQTAEPFLIVANMIGDVAADIVFCRLRDRAMPPGTGSVTPILGIANVDQCWVNEKPLRLYQDPVSFVQNGCDGAVALRWWGGGDTLSLLAYAPSIICETRDLAEELDRNWKQLFSPISYIVKCGANV